MSHFIWWRENEYHPSLSDWFIFKPLNIPGTASSTYPRTGVSSLTVESLQRGCECGGLTKVKFKKRSTPIVTMCIPLWICGTPGGDSVERQNTERESERKIMSPATGWFHSPGSNCKFTAYFARTINHFQVSSGWFWFLFSLHFFVGTFYFHLTAHLSSLQTILVLPVVDNTTQ